MKGPALFVKVAVIELDLQKLKELAELDPSIIFMENIDDGRKQLIKIYFWVSSPTLLWFTFNTFGHFICQFKINSMMSRCLFQT